MGTEDAAHGADQPAAVVMLLGAVAMRLVRVIVRVLRIAVAVPLPVTAVGRVLMLVSRHRCVHPARLPPSPECRGGQPALRPAPRRSPGPATRA